MRPYTVRARQSPETVEETRSWQGAGTVKTGCCPIRLSLNPKPLTPIDHGIISNEIKSMGLHPTACEAGQADHVCSVTTESISLDV